MHFDEEPALQPSAEFVASLEEGFSGQTDPFAPRRGIQLGATSRTELEKKIFKRNLNYYTHKTPDIDYADFVVSKEDWHTLQSHQGDGPIPSFTEWGATPQDSEALLHDRPVELTSNLHPQKANQSEDLQRTSLQFEDSGRTQTQKISV